MRVNIDLKEIFYLSIFFTLLAMYFNVHKEQNVLTFILDHLLALLIALIISKVIYHIITKLK
jgi:hypothetical protein